MIYADNAATTRISESVLEKMLPFLRDQYGNASSQYSFGVKARRAIEQAREQVAVAIGANAEEIVFTSGGTEADSWVIRSVVEAVHDKPSHILTSAIEHPAILNTCHALEKNGHKVTYVPVNNYGLVKPDEVFSAIRPSTKIVSIMLANNEIGTIEPIGDISKVLRGTGILFHTDAVQAMGHIKVSVEDLGIDYLSASAHKFNGPKGVGFLYKRTDIDMENLIFGGKQERGFRAGTENVAGIVGLGYALEESVATMYKEKKRLEKMIDATVLAVQSRIPSATVNGDYKNRLPGTINIGFNDVSGEAMMHLLDLKNICVSTSSACTSGEDKPSHVLLALGLSEQQAKSAIRISYGKYNNLEDVKYIVNAIDNAYKKISALR